MALFSISTRWLFVYLKITFIEIGQILNKLFAYVPYGTIANAVLGAITPESVASHRCPPYRGDCFERINCKWQLSIQTLFSFILKTQ